VEPSSLEDQVRSLTRRLSAIESRLAALEAREPPTTAPPLASADRELVSEALTAGFDGRRWLTALGRSFIILGGAFLLRALTDAAVWPPEVGVSVGLLYALAWLVTSDRAASHGDRMFALADGATALVIGFPLIVESATRFNMFTPAAAALALAGFSVVSLTITFRTRLGVLAWLGAFGGMMTGFTLLVRTGEVAPYSFYFTALGVGTLWLGYLREWKGPRWFTGLLAVAGVFGVTTRALSEPPVDAPATAWFVQGALLIAYFASIAIRTLVRGRQVIPFEVVQSVFVLAVSVGGALAVSQSVGTGGVLLGAALVALGMIAYLVSFAFLARESPGGVNFYFYSTCALAFVLIGLEIAVKGAPQALALTALAVLLAVAWSRSGRVTLGGHAAVALVVASISGGLFALAQGAFVGEPPGPAVLLTAGLTLLVALAVSGSRAADCPTARPELARIPALVIAVAAVAGLAGALTATAAFGAEAALGHPMDAGVLATVRTALLSMLALACAFVDRPGRFSAIGKLAYPLLAATGMKLALADLRFSTPATLFIALACYGAALVLVPRLKKTGGSG
jgi:hypothetical protein